MEDVNGHCPFLPPNYVSLVQLEERWLKEKEKKRREEEGTESKGRGRRSEQYETFEGTKPSSPSFREKDGAVVTDQERKPDELKKKKKKKKKRISRMNREGRKPRNEEIEAGVADQEQDEQKPHESNKKEKEKVKKRNRKIIKPRDEENEGPGNQSRRRNDLRCSVKDQTMLVSRSLENLSLNAGGDRRRRNVSGRFGTGGANLVWVRKGEIATSDTVRVPKRN